jgi:type IV secretion system protein VirB10
MVNWMLGEIYFGLDLFPLFGPATRWSAMRVYASNRIMVEEKVTGLHRAAVVLAIAGYTGFGWGQTPAAEPSQPSATQDTSQAAPSGANSATAPESAAAPSPAGQAASPATKTYTVPAGTRVLLQLRSAINTKSAKPGDGVYLSSAFPVVVGNRVMIPTGVYVQGVVDRVERAGRVKGKAQLDMHFTSMIFPNGTVVEIPGMVNSLPGAKKQSVKEGGEGTIEQDGEKGRNAGEVAKIAIPTGGTVGAIGGLEAGHPIVGGVVGIAAGLAAVGVASIFTRGADVDIASGSQVEMVLQRPLLLEEENLSASVTSGGFAAGTALVPSANQPRPLGKPINPRSQVICPPGSLGCQ